MSASGSKASSQNHREFGNFSEKNLFFIFVKNIIFSGKKNFEKNIFSNFIYCLVLYVLKPRSWKICAFFIFVIFKKISDSYVLHGYINEVFRCGVIGDVFK